MILLCCLLAAIIGAASGVTAVTLLKDKVQNSSDETVVLDGDTPKQNVNISIDKTATSVVEAVAEKVTPSVVGIRTTTSVTNFFGGPFRFHDTERAVRVTIGLFSIVQLERSVQMLIPAYDFCMPGKECSNDTETPCDSFRKIRFPVNEFFPPAESEAQEEAAAFDPPCCCGR